MSSDRSSLAKSSSTLSNELQGTPSREVHDINSLSGTTAPSDYNSLLKELQHAMSLDDGIHSPQAVPTFSPIPYKEITEVSDFVPRLITPYKVVPSEDDGLLSSSHSSVKQNLQLLSPDWHVNDSSLAKSSETRTSVGDSAKVSSSSNIGPTSPLPQAYGDVISPVVSSGTATSSQFDRQAIKLAPADVADEDASSVSTFSHAIEHEDGTYSPLPDYSSHCNSAGSPLSSGSSYVSPQSPGKSMFTADTDLNVEKESNSPSVHEQDGSISLSGSRLTDPYSGRFADRGVVDEADGSLDSLVIVNPSKTDVVNGAKGLTSAQSSAPGSPTLSLPPLSPKPSISALSHSSLNINGIASTYLSDSSSPFRKSSDRSGYFEQSRTSRSNELPFTFESSLNSPPHSNNLKNTSIDSRPSDALVGFDSASHINHSALPSETVTSPYPINDSLTVTPSSDFKLHSVQSPSTPGPLSGNGTIDDIQSDFLMFLQEQNRSKRETASVPPSSSVNPSLSSGNGINSSSFTTNLLSPSGSGVVTNMSSSTPSQSNQFSSSFKSPLLSSPSVPSTVSSSNSMKRTNSVRVPLDNALSPEVRQSLLSAASKLGSDIPSPTAKSFSAPSSASKSANSEFDNDVMETLELLSRARKDLGTDLMFLAPQMGPDPEQVAAAERLAAAERAAHTAAELAARAAAEAERARLKSEEESRQRLHERERELQQWREEELKQLQIRQKEEKERLEREERERIERLRMQERELRERELQAVEELARKERQERERVEKEKADLLLLLKEKQENELLTRERLEREKLERIEQERLAMMDKLEKERLDKINALALEKEKLEKEKLEKEKLEKERLEKEKGKKERPKVNLQSCLALLKIITVYHGQLLKRLRDEGFTSLPRHIGTPLSLALKAATRSLREADSLIVRVTKSSSITEDDLLDVEGFVRQAAMDVVACEEAYGVAAEALRHHLSSQDGSAQRASRPLNGSTTNGSQRPQIRLPESASSALQSSNSSNNAARRNSLASMNSDAMSLPSLGSWAEDGGFPIAGERIRIRAHPSGGSAPQPPSSAQPQLQPQLSNSSRSGRAPGNRASGPNGFSNDLDDEEPSVAAAAVLRKDRERRKNNAPSAANGGNSALKELSRKDSQDTMGAQSSLSGQNSPLPSSADSPKNNYNNINNLDPQQQKALHALLTSLGISLPQQNQNENSSASNQAQKPISKDSKSASPHTNTNANSTTSTNNNPALMGSDGSELKLTKEQEMALQLRNVLPPGFHFVLLPDGALRILPDSSSTVAETEKDRLRERELIREKELLREKELKLELERLEREKELKLELERIEREKEKEKEKYGMTTQERQELEQFRAQEQARRALQEAETQRLQEEAAKEAAKRKAEEAAREALKAAEEKALLEKKEREEREAFERFKRYEQSEKDKLVSSSRDANQSSTSPVISEGKRHWKLLGSNLSAAVAADVVSSGSDKDKEKEKEKEKARERDVAERERLLALKERELALIEKERRLSLKDQSSSEKERRPTTSAKILQNRLRNRRGDDDDDEFDITEFDSISQVGGPPSKGRGTKGDKTSTDDAGFMINNDGIRLLRGGSSNSNSNVNPSSSNGNVVNLGQSSKIMGNRRSSLINSSSPSLAGNSNSNGVELAALPRRPSFAMNPPAQLGQEVQKANLLRNLQSPDLATVRAANTPSVQIGANGLPIVGQTPLQALSSGGMAMGLPNPMGNGLMPTRSMYIAPGTQNGLTSLGSSYNLGGMAQPQLTSAPSMYNMGMQTVQPVQPVSQLPIMMMPQVQTMPQVQPTLTSNPSMRLPNGSNALQSAVNLFQGKKTMKMSTTANVKAPLPVTVMPKHNTSFYVGASGGMVLTNQSDPQQNRRSRTPPPNIKPANIPKFDDTGSSAGDTVFETLTKNF